MASNNTILFKKLSSQAVVKDSLVDFGVAVLEEPMLEPTEVKEVGSQEWLDEHGTDVYNAPKAYFKAFDATFTLGIKATSTDSCHTLYKNFINYLVNGGVLHSIYCEWVKTGRTGVRYVGSSDFEYERNGGDTYITFKAKFNISDPVSEVNENLNIITG